MRDISRCRGSGQPPVKGGEADARTRTGDPFITSEVLYQLSYVGTAWEAKSEYNPVSSESQTVRLGGRVGVGVESSTWLAYAESIAIRISLGLIPCPSMSITARVTPRQTPQVGAIGSKTTEPSGFTRRM